MDGIGIYIQSQLKLGLKFLHLRINAKRSRKEMEKIKKITY